MVVHCTGGCHRVGTVLMAWINHKHNLTYDEGAAEALFTIPRYSPPLMQVQRGLSVRRTHTCHKAWWHYHALPRRGVTWRLPPMHPPFDKTGRSYLLPAGGFLAAWKKELIFLLPAACFCSLAAAAAARDSSAFLRAASLGSRA